MRSLLNHKLTLGFADSGWMWDRFSMRHILSIVGLIGLGFTGACQSSDISFLEPTRPQTQSQQQNPITGDHGEQAIASGPPQSLENPQTNQQENVAPGQTASSGPNTPNPPVPTEHANNTDDGERQNAGAPVRSRVLQSRVHCRRRLPMEHQMVRSETIM